MLASSLRRVFGVRYALVRVAAMAGLSLGYLLFRTGDHQGDLGAADWAVIGLALALCVAGSVAPLWVAIAQAGLLTVTGSLTADGPAVLLVKIVASFALFELAARRPLRQAAIGAAALVVGSAVGKLDELAADPLAVAYGLLVVLGVPLLLGTQLRSAWHLAEQGQQRAEVEAARAAAEVRAARAAERTAIARELHDLVAHQIASMLLRVGVARQVLPNLDHKTKETLDDVHSCATTVLDDLKRLVRVLRAGDNAALIEPDGLRQAIEDAAERGRQLGLRLTTSCDDSIGRIEAVRALTVLRLCQEGLTNVAKHSGPHTTTHIAIRHHRDDSVELEITDEGDGERPASTPDTGGYGLVGMTERVELLGGELSVGTVDNGFRLHAVLPAVSVSDGDTPSLAQPVAGS